MEKRLSLIVWLTIAAILICLKFEGFWTTNISYGNSSTAHSIAMRKGPYLIYSGENTQMDVLWQLDTASSSTIAWGVDTVYGWGSSQTNEYNNDHQHRFTLSNLIPGLKYFYRVSVGNENYKGTFWTAPHPSMARIKFFVYGDTRTDPDTHDKIAGQIDSIFSKDYKYQSFILSVGDLVGDGNVEEDWDNQFFSKAYPNIQYTLANIPFQSAMGNHEGDGLLFEKYFPYPFVSLRYWSFDYGTTHFAIVDQYSPYDSASAQFQWLQQDLASSKQLWKFIVLHEPGWSADGEHENNLDVQKYIQPLCIKYGIPVVFAGHNHYYARAVVDGVEHITTGGGGAPLHKPKPNYPNVVAISRENHFCKVEISGTQFHLAAISIDGAVIDTFTITLNRH